MTWPVQPIGPRPADTIVAVDRTQGSERRRGRDEEDQPKERREPHGGTEGQPGPDADGHIDVLA